MENLTNMEEEELKENNLNELSSEELLNLYGRYRMFMGDESNGASPVYWDIDYDSRIIYEILLERLRKVEGK